MHSFPAMTKSKIKAARERLGETQAEFARRLGVDQATIHRWETRGVPDRGAARIAVESLLASISKTKAAGCAA